MLIRLVQTKVTRLRAKTKVSYQSQVHSISFLKVFINETEPGATGSWSNTCTANSFLLNDGVCDDITNTVECHFDLGDCCLEDKDLKYCLDCSCKLNCNF